MNKATTSDRRRRIEGASRTGVSATSGRLSSSPAVLRIISSISPGTSHPPDRSFMEDAHRHHDGAQRGVSLGHRCAGSTAVRVQELLTPEVLIGDPGAVAGATDELGGCYRHVGAGVAGLKAAQELVAMPAAPVIVLEANNRAGGRLKRAEVELACRLMLGGQWIGVRSATFCLAEGEALRHRHLRAISMPACRSAAACSERSPRYTR